MKITFFILFLLIHQIYCLNDQLCTTPSSSDGYCVTIFDCEKLFPKLKDVNSFKENSCIIPKNKYNYKFTTEIKNKLPWISYRFRSDGTLDFFKGSYTLNEAGVCCPI